MLPGTVAASVSPLWKPDVIDAVALAIVAEFWSEMVRPGATSSAMPRSV